MGGPEFIPTSPICFENSIHISMALFRNTEKLSKIRVKSMVKSCQNDVFTYFEILYYASSMLLYAFVTLIALTVLVCILPLLYFVCPRFRYNDFYYSYGLYLYASFIMIPVYTTIIFLLWILLSRNTHLEISWKISSLMNWSSSYSPIVRKITL